MSGLTERLFFDPPRVHPRPQTIDDLIDFTPELRAEAIEIIKKYVSGPAFTPASVVGDGPTDKKGSIQLPASVGGADGPAPHSIRKPGCSTSRR